MIQRIRCTASSVRVEKYQGRDHVVVPVVALVEGVIEASNSDGPELALLEEFSRNVQAWNNRPVMFQHPEAYTGGTPVSANDPRVLDGSAIGTIFNARVEGKKLLMEAWIDPERAEAVGAGGLLKGIRGGKIADVSVGIFTSSEATQGTYAGKPYIAIWRGIVPDHLAFLPEGASGACSVSMGCGTRAASRHPGVRYVDRIPSPPPFYGMRPLAKYAGLIASPRPFFGLLRKR